MKKALILAIVVIMFFGLSPGLVKAQGAKNMVTELEALVCANPHRTEGLVIINGVGTDFCELRDGKLFVHTNNFYLYVRQVEAVKTTYYLDLKKDGMVDWVVFVSGPVSREDEAFLIASFGASFESLIKEAKLTSVERLFGSRPYLDRRVFVRQEGNGWRAVRFSDGGIESSETTAPQELWSKVVK